VTLWEIIPLIFRSTLVQFPKLIIAGILLVLSKIHLKFRLSDQENWICREDTLIYSTEGMGGEGLAWIWVMIMGRHTHTYLKNKRPIWCHLLFYFTSYVLNMFRTLIYPSSGACDCAVELPHWSYCSWFDVCWSFGVVWLECASACNTDATPTQPHRNSNTHRTKNNTTNVVIQQHSRKLLMMDILMSETCW